MATQFSTLNESSLHKTLKKLYSLQKEGSKTEVELDGHVYDIVTTDNQVIEIQNLNVSKLFNKCKDALEKGRKVTIVHPVVIEKTICLVKSDGSVKKRKSPKKGSIYSLCRELTGIYPLLLEKNFKLEVPLVTISEIREQTDYPVQSKNNLRRFKRDWIKKDKKLNSIIDIKTFNSKSDYIALLPKELPELFSTGDVKKKIAENKDVPASACKNANILLWLLSKMNLISKISKEGNAYIYKIN